MADYNYQIFITLILKYIVEIIMKIEQIQLWMMRQNHPHQIG